MLDGMFGRRRFSVGDAPRARVSGIARTAQGPTMSTSAGKIVIDGPAIAGSDRVLALRFLQARNAEWVSHVREEE